MLCSFPSKSEFVLLSILYLSIKSIKKVFLVKEKKGASKCSHGQNKQVANIFVILDS